MHCCRPTTDLFLKHLDHLCTAVFLDHLNHSLLHHFLFFQRGHIASVRNKFQSSTLDNENLNVSCSHHQQLYSSYFGEQFLEFSPFTSILQLQQQNTHLKVWQENVSQLYSAHWAKQRKFLFFDSNLTWKVLSLEKATMQIESLWAKTETQKKVKHHTNLQPILLLCDHHCSFHTIACCFWTNWLLVFNYGQRLSLFFLL